MKNCGYCETTNNDDAIYCRHCGSKFTTIAELIGMCDSITETHTEETKSDNNETHEEESEISDWAAFYICGVVLFTAAILLPLYWKNSWLRIIPIALCFGLKNYFKKLKGIQIILLLLLIALALYLGFNK